MPPPKPSSLITGMRVFCSCPIHATVFLSVLVIERINSLDWAAVCSLKESIIVKIHADSHDGNLSV